MGNGVGFVLTRSQAAFMDSHEDHLTQLGAPSSAAVRAAFAPWDIDAYLARNKAYLESARNLKSDVERQSAAIKAEAAEGRSVLALAQDWRGHVKEGLEHGVKTGKLGEHELLRYPFHNDFGTTSQAGAGLRTLVRTLLDRRVDAAQLLLPADMVARGEALLLSLHRERGELAIAELEREYAARALRPLLEAMAKDLQEYVDAASLTTRRTGVATPRVDLDVIRSAIADTHRDAPEDAPPPDTTNGLT
jgi:hypothetical protein